MFDAITQVKCSLESQIVPRVGINLSQGLGEQTIASIGNASC